MRRLPWLLALLLTGLASYVWYDDSLRETLLNRLPVAVKSDTTPLYRWQDAQGHWQLSDQPPAGRSYEVVRYPRDLNVVPAVKPEED